MGMIMSEYVEEYFYTYENCQFGDKAYLISLPENCLKTMKVIHVIRRSDNMEAYDNLVKNENILLEGEAKYHADTSAEFITDKDCMLVWFKFV